MHFTEGTMFGLYIYYTSAKLQHTDYYTLKCLTDNITFWNYILQKEVSSYVVLLISTADIDSSKMFLLALKLAMHILIRIILKNSTFQDIIFQCDIKAQLKMYHDK